MSRPIQYPVVIFLTCLIGACTVHPAPQSQRAKSDLERHIADTGRVDLDLRTPLTVESGGLRPENGDLVVERSPGGPPIIVELQLPFETLILSAFRLAILVAPGSPEGSQPDMIYVNERVGSEDAAHERLLELVPHLGLDSARVTDWFRAASADDEGTPAVFRTIDGAPQDYLRIGVEARTGGGDGGVLLTWLFDWSNGFSST